MTIMNNGIFTKVELEHIVSCCLQKLRRIDRYLLAQDVNERTIAHKLAEYLQQHIPEFNVDCEYNRFEKAEINDIIKRIEIPRNGENWDHLKIRNVNPDIIIHERGPQGRNILVVEVKKSSNQESETLDRNKLIVFTQEPLNYDFGLFLKIDIENNNDIIDWYYNGTQII